MTLLEIIRRAVNENEADGSDHSKDCFCGTADDGDTAVCWMREARAVLRIQNDILMGRIPKKGA